MSAQLHRRLRIAAGQVMGVSRMVEQGRDLSELLTQLRAVTAALDDVEELYLRHELRPNRRELVLLRMLLRHSRRSSSRS